MKEKKIFIIYCCFGAICIIFSVTFIFFNILYPFAYKELIVKYGKENDLDCSLIASIIYCESRYNKNVVSNKGAIGLMQLMPSTAESFYYEDNYSIKLLYNPEYNIKIGTTYLKYLFDKYNDEITVLACYNAGEAVVRKWMGDGFVLKKTQIKYKETLKYVEKVLKSKKIYAMRF